MDPSSRAQLGKTPSQLRELCHEGGHVLVIVAQRGPIHVRIAARNSGDEPITYDADGRHRHCRSLCLSERQAQVLECERKYETATRVGL